MFQLDETNSLKRSSVAPLSHGKLTVDVDVDVGGDGLGVIVVVPPALQPGVPVRPGEPLQLHRVPALPGRDLLPGGVQDLALPPPGDAGAGPP